jgi:hypothetical protein
MTVRSLAGDGKGLSYPLDEIRSVVGDALQNEPLHLFSLFIRQSRHIFAPIKAF